MSARPFSAAAHGLKLERQVADGRHARILTDQMRESERLQTALEDYKGWRLSQGADLDDSLYPHWNQLSDAFLALLYSSAPSDWGALELEAIQNALTASRNFIELIPEELILDVFTQSYPERSFRMSLLAESRNLRNAGKVEKVLLHFFLNDESEAINDHAFKMLASRRWCHVEEFAEKLWKTGDTARKMAVLSALENYGSEQLEHFLELASDEAELLGYVRSIRTLRDSHRW